MDISSEVGLRKRESPHISKVKAPTDGMHRVLLKKKKKERIIKEPKTNTVSSSSGKKCLHYDSRGGMQEGLPRGGNTLAGFCRINRSWLVGVGSAL